MNKAAAKSLKNFSTVWELTKRNILLFLKNKGTVIFSLLAPMLILVFYILFLGDMQVGVVRGMIPEGITISDKSIKSISNSWMISGVVGISCLTISLNSMLVIIADKEKKTINDFIASPIKSVTLLTSYFLSSFILTFCLCFLVLIVAIIFIAASSGSMFSFAEIAELILILFLSCLSAVTVMICIMSLFKTNSSSAAFSGVFSAIIGFLTGAYLPISMMPTGVQNFANLIPGSHSTGLFRNLFINKALKNLSDVPQSFIDSITENYSINLKLFGAEIGRSMMYVYLTASIFVFFIIYLIINRLQNRYKK